MILQIKHPLFVVNLNFKLYIAISSYLMYINVVFLGNYNGMFLKQSKIFPRWVGVLTFLVCSETLCIPLKKTNSFSCNKRGEYWEFQSTGFLSSALVLSTLKFSKESWKGTFQPIIILISSCCVRDNLSYWRKLYELEFMLCMQETQNSV